MMLRFGKGQTCEVFISDGNHTIGYVDDTPSEWDGNGIELKEGEWYARKDEGSAFGVNCQDEFIVHNGRWTENVA